MKIRLLKESDLDKGFASCLETLGSFKTTELIKVYKERKKYKIKTFVVVEGDRVIATASLILEPKFRYNEICGHVEDVCVLPEKQGFGVGKKIMKYLINYAKHKKCYKLILSSRNDNIAFYSKLGFHLHENHLRLDII
jgi:N-acetylglutamate synthase-like GNAT family acetyltransferase